MRVSQAPVVTRILLQRVPVGHVDRLGRSTAVCLIIGEALELVIDFNMLYRLHGEQHHGKATEPHGCGEASEAPSVSVR